MSRKKVEARSLKPGTLPKIQLSRNVVSRTKYLQVGLALFVLALAAYSNSFRGGFVFDSQPIVLLDPRIREVSEKNIGLILQHTYWWPRGETKLYRPVTTLSYMLNYAVVGQGTHPEGYHWFNFFLHALNAYLLFLVALRFLRKLLPAALAAGLWTVHPVLTESVTNIVGRADLLAGACTLSGFLFYLKSTESKGWERWAWLISLTAVTAIGVFSKESAVAILGVIVVYELTWWNERHELRGLLLGCTALAPAFLLLFYQRWVVLSGSFSAQEQFLDNPLVNAGFLQGKLTAIAVMAKYLLLLVWPASLSCDYSYATIPIAKGGIWDWVSWIAVLTLAVVVLWQYGRNKVLFFFPAFGFVTFLTVSNLLFPIGTIMAERFLYLPAACFAVGVVVLIQGVLKRIGRPAAAPIVLCLIVGVLCVRTWQRNLVWQDDLTFWKSAVESAPKSFRSHGNLAKALFQSDPTHSNIDQILAESEKGLVILDPLPDALNTENAYSEAAFFYMTKAASLDKQSEEGKPVGTDGSRKAYERAQQLLKRGVAIQKTFEANFRAGERARGKSDAEIPLTGAPSLYANLAEVSIKLGDKKTAFEAAEHARLLDPQNAGNYKILSGILLEEGKKEDAAVRMVEGFTISGDKELLGRLREQYGTGGLDPKGCAILHGARGDTLNSACEPVHNELCAAYADLVSVFQRKQRADIAEYTKKTARELGCPAEGVR